MTLIFFFFQVGACIVNVENKIVGIGYNGMPVGCNDDEMPWGRNPENLLESKQLYGEFMIIKFRSLIQITAQKDY